MTSPYTPEFDFADWPNGPLQAHLPAGSGPNAVLNQVEAEFGNVAEAFTGLAEVDGALDARLAELDTRLGAIRDAINALLAGGLPTSPDLPVSAGAGDDVANRAVLLDTTGGLVVIWSSPRVNNTSHVYASRLDLARPQDGFSPAVAVTSGTTAAFAPSAVVLPNGDLIVAYATTGGIRMKRAPLAGLPAASPQTVSTSGGGTASALLTGGRVVFFIDGVNWPGQWSYRRYDHAAGTFVDGAPVAFTEQNPISGGPLHATVSGRFAWLSYFGVDRESQPFEEIRRFNPADGAFTAGGSAGGMQSPPFVLAVSETEALVFYDVGTGIRVATTKIGAQTTATTVPGTAGVVFEPAAVRDADGTIHLFYIRALSATDRAVMLVRRSPLGDWGPHLRLGLRSVTITPLQPVFVPGQGVWLVYQSNRTGNVDLYAARILTAI